MSQHSSRESQPHPRRRGKAAATIAVLAMALTACGDNTQAEPGVYRDVHAAVAELPPTAAEVSYYHQLNLVSTLWRAPEKTQIGDETITLFREFDKQGTAETAGKLVKAVQNSALLQEALSQPSADRNFYATNSHIRHEFFVFDSVESLAQAESMGLYGPFTTSLPNLQGQVVENVTLLAPFPFRNFIFASELNSSIFELQAAVSNNMIDITLGQGMIDTLLNAVPDEGYAWAEAIASASATIKQSMSENLALAVTIKTGRDILSASGYNDYDYYSTITDALRDEALYYGVDRPYFKLAPNAYGQIVT